MKKISLLILTMLLALPAWGQISNPSIIYTASAPSGSCVAAPPVYVLTSTGAVYTCNNGTWGIAPASVAAQVALTSKADNVNYYCLFAGANSSTSQPVYVGSCTYNPSTNTSNVNTSGTAAGLSGAPALPNGTTATTQSQADGSTKIATTAYVDTGLSGKQAALTNPVTWTTGYTGSVASATPTTLFTIPNPTVFAIYLVTATFDGYGNYGGFGATALVSAGNNSNAITTLTAGVNFSLGLSGNNVQVTIIYALGSPIRWGYVKVMGY